MYRIWKGLDGLYHCEGRLQDGTERWTEKTMKAAVYSLKEFAKVCNRTRIKRKDISYFEEEPVQETKLVPVLLPKRLS